MSKKKYLYLMISKDKYELPMAVADSPTELAGIVGKSANAIRSSICKGECGKFKSRYIRVEIGDLDDE